MHVVTIPYFEGLFFAHCLSRIILDGNSSNNPLLRGPILRTNNIWGHTHIEDIG